MNFHSYQGEWEGQGKGSDEGERMGGGGYTQKECQVNFHSEQGEGVGGERRKRNHMGVGGGVHPERMLVKFHF